MHQVCKSCGELFEIERDTCPYCGAPLFSRETTVNTQDGLNHKAIAKYAADIKKEKTTAKRKRFLVSGLLFGGIIFATLFIIAGYWVVPVFLFLVVIIVFMIASLIDEYPAWIKEKQKKRSFKMHGAVSFVCPVCGSDNIHSVGYDLLNTKLECGDCGYIW